MTASELVVGDARGGIGCCGAGTGVVMWPALAWARRMVCRLGCELCVSIVRWNSMDMWRAYSSRAVVRLVWTVCAGCGLWWLRMRGLMGGGSVLRGGRLVGVLPSLWAEAGSSSVSLMSESLMSGGGPPSLSSSLALGVVLLLRVRRKALWILLLGKDPTEKASVSEPGLWSEVGSYSLLDCGECWRLW